VEVVSFGLIPIGGQPFSEGTMLHQINSASPWRTTELIEGAAAAANRHSRWWQGIPQSRFVAADLRKFNGRREDDLSPLVSRFVHGKISRTALQAAAYEIRNARTEVEQARIRRVLDARIGRAVVRAQRMT
jgi:hypothetical protein